MKTTPFRLVYYTDASGRKPFRDWFLALRDRTAMQRIAVRLDRLEIGNPGDCKAVGEGIWELRIVYGPGYRIYFAFDDNAVVLLLVGGDKGSQTKDIQTAKKYWRDHEERAQ